MDPLHTHRIALVGAGQVARTGHLPAYARRERLEVVAICDRDPEVAALAAEAFGVADVTTSLDDLLGMDHVDVVDVAVPAGAHRAVTRRVLRAGKHALVQRPFTRHPDEARELVELARSQGLQLAVNLNHRFEPTLREAGRLLRAGELGQATSTFFEHRHLVRPAARRGAPGESPLLEHVLPKLDLLLSWFGRPETVHASCEPSHGLFTLRFPDGHQAAVLEDLAPSSPDLRRLFVNGSEGALRGDGPGLEWFPRGEVHGAWQELPVEGDDLDAFADVMGAFCRAIELGAAPEHSAADHLGVLEVVEAARRSACEVRTVWLDEVEGEGRSAAA